MGEFEEIMEKVKNFLEQKEGLDSPSCYCICKTLMEDYWIEWREEDSPQKDDDDFSDFEGGEEQNDSEDDDEVDDFLDDKPKKTITKKQSVSVKKPVIRLKED